MEVRIRLLYPRLTTLSDRTLSNITRQVARAMRRVRETELLFVARSLGLSRRELQSTMDRMDRRMDGLATYYVERVERGSLLIEAVLAAGAIWFLQATIGESVKDAWKQTRTHRAIVAYLSNDPWDDPTDSEAVRFNAGVTGARWKLIDREISANFGIGTQFDRFEVVDLAIAPVGESPGYDMEVEITFGLSSEVEAEPDERLLDAAKVIAEIQSKLDSA